MNDFHEEEFVEKLLGVLKRITDAGGKQVDNNYLERLLMTLRTECDSDVKYEKYMRVPRMFHWLLEVVELWKVEYPTCLIASFMIQFVSILTKKEDGFKDVAETKILDEIVKMVKSSVGDNYNLKISFIKLFNDLINHRSGCDWIISNKHWLIIFHWLFSNYNFYVEQEGLAFLKKFLKQIHPNDDVTDCIIHEIVRPLNEIQKNGMINNDEGFCAKHITSLKLLTAILRSYALDHPQIIKSKLSKIFNVEKEVKIMLENCSKEDVLEVASELYILYTVVMFEDRSALLVMDSVPPEIMNILWLLLKKDQINCLLKLIKFCQLLWNDLRIESNCESRIGMHFIIFQFIPMCALKIDPESKMFDSYVQKLFNLTSQSSQKLGFAMRDKVRRKPEVKKWALKGLLSVTGNTDCLKQDEVVLIFQFLAYTLLYFVPGSRDIDENSDESSIIYHTGNGTCSNSENVSLLSAVLNSLCLFIEKFKINWAESLESLCLLKMACDLLENGNLSCILVVQTLLLVKLAILNSMSPNLAFLLNKTEDSSFQCLLPLLYKHLHNPNWEIRDSCIEVITTIAELAESKYPSLQEVLLAEDFLTLVQDMMGADSESYVRASALRALAAMTKIERFQSRLSDLTFPSKIIDLLRSESEGVVRREAVLLLKQIYLSLNLTPEVERSFYEIMDYAATLDLHWEVKANSLAFWEAAIHRIFADQGMIDGSFPKVTFSKEHKKIITMTGEEIKARLGKALVELSEIGCLHVLVSTLNDCDYQVVKKSAEILTMFLNILKRFDYLKGDERDLSGRIPVKRKHVGFDFIENEENCKMTRENYKRYEDGSEAGTDRRIRQEHQQDSDAVIEEIVNEMDINLLVSVHRNRNVHLAEKTSDVKAISLEKIKPEVFLEIMRNFELNSFLRDKKKWLLNGEPDLRSLVNDIAIMNSSVETNVMDCY